MFFYKRYKEAVRDTPPSCAVKPNTKKRPKRSRLRALLAAHCSPLGRFILLYQLISGNRLAD